MKYDEKVHHTLWALSFFFFLIVLPWFGHVFSNKGRFGHKRKLPGFFYFLTCGFATYHEITRGKRTGFVDFSEPHAPDLRIFEISHSHKTNKSTEKYTIKLYFSTFVQLGISSF